MNSEMSLHAVALVICATSGLLRDQELPDEVWPVVRESVAEAESCIAARRHHFACARLEALLYPGGVTVAISTGSVTPKTAAFISSVEQASSVWNYHLGGDSPIRWVSERDNPEVLVQFVHDMPADGPNALGSIEISRNFRWNGRQHAYTVRGTISILTTHGGQTLTGGEVAEIALHEFGHLLGLGDTRVQGTLMGRMERGKLITAPTPNEVQAVKTLRGLLRRKLDRLAELMKSDQGLAVTAAVPD